MDRSAHNDLGLSSTRPAGYMPSTKNRVTIPVRENSATNLRKQKMDVKSSGGLKTFRVPDATKTSPDVVKKTPNEQIFVERTALVSHWFDLWTVKQRKRFLLEMFERCGQNELDFVQSFSDGALAVKRKDFTNVLPAFVSKYIFSLLDPKSLSRAAQVSTHWRMLSESDEIWIPKCVRHGWFLQYSPSSFENGAWKRHYVQSLRNLVPGKPAVNDGLAGDGLQTDRSDLFSEMKTLSQVNTPRTARQPVSARSFTGTSQLSLEDRPKWQDPDKRPKELQWDKFEESTRDNQSPDNQSKPATSSLLFSSRFGVSSFLSDKEYGLGSTERTTRHHMRNSSEFETSLNQETGSLGDLLQAERVAEGSDDLKVTPWHYPEKQAFENRFDAVDVLNQTDNRTKDLAEKSADYPSHSHPRVVFISSRLPAKDMLQEAVMYGVISIVYEYEGTTLETLIALLNNVLKARQARSIAFITDGQPGEVFLVNNATISLDTLDRPDIKQFWLDVALNLLPAGVGSHIDMFAPLASCDSGMELLFQLNVLTGMKFTSPINMIGGIRSIVGDWLEHPEGMKPLNHYFKTLKITTWVATASRVTEALYATNRFLSDFFSVERRALLSEMSGKIVFDALNVGSLKAALVEVLPVVIDAFMEYKIGKNAGKIPALKYVSQYLDERSQAITSGGEEKQDQGKDDEEDDVIADLLCMTKYERERAFKLLSTKNIENEPDRRATVAVELLSSELEYMRTLTIVTDVFMKPLKQTLDAAKPIIGVGNIHALFSDISNILEVSKALLKEITTKVDNWTSSTTLADVMIKFSGKVKAYTNYVNNYPGVMKIFDKLIEENPAFRAFIASVEETPMTKMLSYHELYMTPTRRISEYILLLQALQINTPVNHADKQDLNLAITKLESLNEFIHQNKTKLVRDATIGKVEKRIINCPRLLEGNREFVREDYASLMKQHMDNSTAEGLEYSHIQDLAMFLFTDSLVICVVRKEHVPFQKVVNSRILFSTCLALSKIKVEVIADTKFIQHAVKLSTKKSNWVLKLSSYRDRVTFVHTLEATIRRIVETE